MKPVNNKVLYYIAEIEKDACIIQCESTNRMQLMKWNCVA